MSDIDQSDLFQTCKQLQNQLQTIRTQKLNSQIQEHTELLQNQFLTKLTNEHHKIQQKYTTKSKQLNKRHEQITTKINKNKQEIIKQLGAYKEILKELEARKLECQKEYEVNVGKVGGIKEKFVLEWKKSSNGSIMGWNFGGGIGRFVGRSNSNGKSKNNISSTNGNKSIDQITKIPKNQQIPTSAVSTTTMRQKYKLSNSNKDTTTLASKNIVSSSPHLIQPSPQTFTYKSQSNLLLERKQIYYKQRESSSSQSQIHRQQ